jgi:CheY-like chemotaxis protein
VRQILYNLISNGLKFTEAGEVRVSVNRDADGALRLRVADTGIGIPADAMPRLFQKFSQADNSTTRRFGGTGLGLTISRRLAELMDGDISVTSEPGAGSVFDVRLALQWLGEPARAQAAPTLAPAAAEMEGLRILAAEDNLTNQLVLKTILQALGAPVEIVSDGRAAVEAWQGRRYDLILMDVQMPVMDGVSATREIRRIEAEQRLPRTRILALSANAMSHQVDEYLRAGMDGHLAKPIEIEKLHAALAEAATAPEEVPLAAVS